MRIHGRGLANLHITRLGLGHLELGHQVIRLDYFRQHRSGRDVLSDMQRKLHQNTVDSGSNFERLKLLLLQLRQHSHLLDFGLLLGKLRLDRFLTARQPLVFQIVADRHLVRFAFRILVGHSRDHAEFV